MLNPHRILNYLYVIDSNGVTTHCLPPIPETISFDSLIKLINRVTIKVILEILNSQVLDIIMVL